MGTPANQPGLIRKGKIEMFRCISLALIMVGFTVMVSAQEFLTAPQIEKQPSFELLKAHGESYIAEKTKDIRRLELMFAETEAKTRKDLKEIAEYNRHLESQLEVLQFVRERLSQTKDRNVVLVGNRHYPSDSVEVNVTARCEEIADTAQRRDKKAGEVRDWQESIRKQKASLDRVKNQLLKAKTILEEQQVRRERAVQELAVSEIVRHTCPEGELLLASDTELGRILWAIEVEVWTLEAFLEMKQSEVEVDLSDIRKVQRTSNKKKEQNNE
ncbi:hypothetical protein ACFL47_02670 [Candidatus Latescibacterota bacterium]